MSAAIQKADEHANLERVIAEGDLSRLTAQERVQYYSGLCKSLGLNPLTKPFEYLKLNGKFVMYARKDCTDQLRRVHKVSLTIVSREKLEDVYIVTARATLPDGRCDEAIGALSIAGLKGEALSNAIMKCETKAKRRVTLSIVGLGITDESEVESIPKAERIEVTADGEVIEEKAPASTPRPVPQPVGNKLMYDMLRSLIDMGDLEGFRKQVKPAMSELSDGQVKSLRELYAAKQKKPTEAA